MYKNIYYIINNFINDDCQKAIGIVFLHISENSRKSSTIYKCMVRFVFVLGWDAEFKYINDK